MTKYREKINQWHEKSKNSITNDDFYAPFLFEYVAFNALYNVMQIDEKSYKIIMKIKRGNKWSLTINDRDRIQYVKNYLKIKNLTDQYLNRISDNLNQKEKKQNFKIGTQKKRFQGWWGNNEYKSKRISEDIDGVIKNESDYINMIEYVYRVRNNLVHGDKSATEFRDRVIVKKAYFLLFPLVEVLLESKPMMEFD